MANKVGKTIKIGTGAILALALCLLASLSADKLGKEWDFSPDARFTIHPHVAELVSDLSTDVRIVGIWPRSHSDPRFDDLIRTTDDRLRRIAALSKHISYRHIDSELDQPEMELFKEQQGEALPGNVYLVTEGKKAYSIPLTLGLTLSLQRDFAGGLDRILSDTLLPLYVIQGHGELQADGTADGIDLFLKRAEHAGFTPTPVTRSTISAEGWGRLPTDGIAVIAGPLHPLGDTLISQLDTYLQNGGRLCVFLDDRCPTDLRQLLERYGIVLTDGMVAHSLNHSFHGKDLATHRLLLDDNFGIQPHRATARLNDGQHTIISPRTNRIRIFTEIDEQTRGELRKQGVFAPLDSNQQAILAVPLGPVWLGAAHDRTPHAVAEDERNQACILAAHLRYPAIASVDGPRITIWGSRSVIANNWLAQTTYGNDILAGDLLTHLTDRDSRHPIPDAARKRFEVSATHTTLNWIMVILVALLPSSCIGIAILAWWERR